MIRWGFETIGLPEAVNYWRQFPIRERKALEAGLKKASQMLLREMKRRVPVSSGDLKKALRIRTPSKFEHIVGADSRNRYAHVVEAGRKAGAKAPPLSSRRLQRWLRQHNIPKNEWYAVARSIGQKGILARPFMAESLQAVGDKMFKELVVRVQRAMKRRGK